MRHIMLSSSFLKHFAFFYTWHDWLKNSLSIWAIDKWIDNSMKSHCPFTSLTFHLEPSVISFIVFFWHIEAKSLTLHWLVIRPSTSKFNIIFYILKFNVSSCIKVLRTDIESLQEWMNLVSFLKMRWIFNSHI